MNRLLIAFAATAMLSTAAHAQSNETANPVPGTGAGENSAIPAGAASTVIVPRDAPVATTAAGTSAVPVPGNSSGIDSAMPADAASSVVTSGDAAPAPNSMSASPVPGTSKGDTVIPATK